MGGLQREELFGSLVDGCSLRTSRSSQVLLKARPKLAATPPVVLTKSSQVFRAGMILSGVLVSEAAFEAGA